MGLRIIYSNGRETREQLADWSDSDKPPLPAWEYIHETPRIGVRGTFTPSRLLSAVS